MEARSIRRIAEKIILIQEPPNVWVIESRLRVDEARLFIFLMAGVSELVRTYTDTITLVAPRVVEDRLAG